MSIFRRRSLQRLSPWDFLLAAWCLAHAYVGQSFLAHNRANDGDSSAFYYCGRLMARGGVLYRDYWDQKPPAIYWQNALLVLGLGDDFGSWAVLHGGVSLALCALLFATLRSILASPWPHLATGAFAFAFQLYSYQDAGNRTEFGVAVLDFSAALIFLQALRSGGRRAHVWCGALSAMAFLYKPVGMACWLAVLAFSALDASRGCRERWQAAIHATAGFCAVLCLALLYLGSQGTLGSGLEAALLFPLKASSQAGLSYPRALGILLRSLGPIWPLLALALATPLLLCRSSLPLLRRRQLGFAGLFLAATFCGVVAQRFGRPHYHMPAVGPVVLLGVLVAAAIAESLGRRGAALLAMALLLSLVVTGRWPLLRQWQRWREIPAIEASQLPYRDMARWLGERLGPGETFFSWSFGYTLYNLTDRPCPVRATPFFIAFPGEGVRLVREDLARLAAGGEELRFIVENLRVRPDLFTTGSAFPEGSSGREALQVYRSWRDAHFHAVPAPVANFSVYERNAGPFVPALSP